MPKIVFPLIIVLLVGALAIIFLSNARYLGGSGGVVLNSSRTIPGLFGASLDSNQIPQLPESNSVSPDVSPLDNQEDVQLQVPETIVETSEQHLSQPVPSNEKQDQIDDILEKIDILKKQIADLTPVPIPAVQIEAVVKDTGSQASVRENNTSDNLRSLEPRTILASTTYSHGGGNIIYPKILISEVQITGNTDAKEEFVELYNPNDQDVELTDWYLQRKTKNGSGYSSFAPNALFLSKKIAPKGYFLIAREGTGFITEADIVIDNPLTQDNSLTLKNPNGDSVDVVGWGQAQDYELLPTENPSGGQSIGRKLVSGEDTDTNNNASDFEIDTPTPKAPNSTFIVGLAMRPHGDAVLQPVTLKHILINEIQIAGITAKDEFITLFNPNSVDVNLEGFSLKKKTSNGNESNLVSAGAFLGNIPALGYFLIVPKTNDDGTKTYTGLVTPDLYYSGKSFSVASDNTVLLYDGDDKLLDKIGFGSVQDFETAPAENPPDGESLRRINGQDTDNNKIDFQLVDINSQNPDTHMDAVTDTQAPLRSNGQPVQMFPAGTTQTNISLQTDEPATCRYSSTLGQDYDATFTTFLTTSGTSHTTPVDSLNDGTTYTYYIKCADASGNKNTDDFVIAFSIGSLSAPLSVVFNEIAWMGTVESAQNEWIELKNTTSQDISVDGWTVVWSDGGTTIPMQGTILAHGFFLLERTDDTSVPTVTADQIYKGALANTGEDMYLYDALGNTIDRVNCSAKWFAGDSATTKTMERKDTSLLGSDNQNWTTSQNVDGSPRS